MIFYRAAEMTLFVTGLAIGVACANDSSAQTAASIAVIPDDTVGIKSGKKDH